jgi:hypothetical protein
MDAVLLDYGTCSVSPGDALAATPPLSITHPAEVFYHFVLPTQCHEVSIFIARTRAYHSTWGSVPQYPVRLSVLRSSSYRSGSARHCGNESLHLSGWISFVISPITRTIQTAINMVQQLQAAAGCIIPAQIWPDLREANDAVCNLGFGRIEMKSRFPRFLLLGVQPDLGLPRSHRCRRHGTS